MSLPYKVEKRKRCEKWRIRERLIKDSFQLVILWALILRRLTSRTEYMSMMNSYWVRPSKRETPEGIQKVEGGSYW